MHISAIALTIMVVGHTHSNHYYGVNVAEWPLNFLAQVGHKCLTVATAKLAFNTALSEAQQGMAILH